MTPTTPRRPRAAKAVAGCAVCLTALAALAGAFLGCAAGPSHHYGLSAAPQGRASTAELAPYDTGRTPAAGGTFPGGAGSSAAARGFTDAPAAQGNPSGAAGAPRADGRALVAAESLPSRDEELWVIEKPTDPPAPQPADDDPAPGTGTLMARDPRTQIAAPAPLRHTGVRASVAGYVATVEVTQQFQNPYDAKIEAVYVFPLPHNAAVSDFLMTIGGRKIRGVVRERKEARRIYEAARGQGYVAALMTQERPNVFTQSVANIEPGKSIDVTIQYFHTLSYSDGWYEFVFPTVVGPRFNPPGPAEDGGGGGIGAVPRGAPGTSGRAPEIQYLRPGRRSGHDIALSVHVDAGVAIEQVECQNHKAAVSRPRPAVADVSLGASDTIPNKDFVLRYQVAGKAVKSAVMTQLDERGEGGGYFTLALYPPQSPGSLPRKPLEMVFTVDVSGSQQGVPLAQEKAAAAYALTHLGPEDTFQVVKFGDRAETLFPQPVPAEAQNVRRAVQWVNAFQAGGGTMLVDGLRASLDFPHDPSRLRFVVFLTDGLIGNETQALAETQRRLGPSRVFSFGVCSAPNRYLLDHLARMGNGAAAYVGLGHDEADGKRLATEAMAQVFERISRPALTDVSIDWGELRVQEVFPQRVPDLFAGRPVVLTGKFIGPPPSAGAATIRVRGKVGNEETQFDVPVRFDDPARRGLAAVWARHKIADLADRAAYEPAPDLSQQIKRVALEYGLMSEYTAFVAVDSLTHTAGDHGASVAVPVLVPAGTRYDTPVSGQ